SESTRGSDNNLPDEEDDEEEDELRREDEGEGEDGDVVEEDEERRSSSRQKSSSTSSCSPTVFTFDDEKGDVGRGEEERLLSLLKTPPLSVGVLLLDEEDVLIAEDEVALEDADDGTETFTTEIMFLRPPPPLPPLPLPVFRLFPGGEL
ncbi:hypothetical protein CSUI_006719, partial [Cystoisospora suis]